MIAQALTILAFAALLTPPARAADAPPARCTDVSVPKNAVESHGGRWTPLTSNQWQFLRGIYAMNPATPPGLPYGDKAVLAQVADDSGGMIVFLDGTRACTPMAVPGALVKMLSDVASGTVTHEGDGM